MKIQSLPVVLVTLALMSAPSRAETKPWQTGKILAVEKHEPEISCCYSATDAPLQSNVVEYEISVQIRDTTYVGLYQTFTGYVPGTWAKDQAVDTTVDKHFLYLKTPSGEVMRLPLLRHKRGGKSPIKVCSITLPAPSGASIGIARPV